MMSRNIFVLNYLLGKKSLSCMIRARYTVTEGKHVTESVTVSPTINWKFSDRNYY